MARMSEARLAEIKAMLAEIEEARERLTGIMGPRDRPRAPVLIAAHDLLTDNEWLRAREAALAKMVEYIANSGNAEDFRQRSAYLLNYHVYATDEIRQQAHALLAEREV